MWIIPFSRMVGIAYEFFYKLRHIHQIVFRYVGNSAFHITVFPNMSTISTGAKFFSNLIRLHCRWEILISHCSSDIISFPLLFFSIWKLCCFVIWLDVGTNLCYWLRLYCTLVDHSGAISLVWTTRVFYPWFEGFSMLKILVPLFVFLVLFDYCSS